MLIKLFCIVAFLCFLESVLYLFGLSKGWKSIISGVYALMLMLFIDGD